MAVIFIPGRHPIQLFQVKFASRICVYRFEKKSYILIPHTGNRICSIKHLVKAVSKLMGHAKLITLDVYGDNSNIIPEELPELLSHMEDVVPKKESWQSMASNVVLDIVIDVGEYLTKTGSD